MTKKRNLLLVSLLLVFGLGVAAPSLFAQVVLQGAYNTNNYIRNEGDAEAVGTIGLTATNTVAGTIVAGSTITFTYNAIIAANGTAAAPTYAVGVVCSANWPAGGCPSFLAGTIAVSTTTTPPSSTVVLSFPANVVGIVQSTPAMGISIATRVVAQGLAYGSTVNATISSFVPAGFILTNTISIFSYATQPFLLATVGPKAATTTAVTPLSVIACIGTGATVASATFTLSITENWANALTSIIDETALETDTNSGAPTNGSNILITLAGIPTGMKVVAGAITPCAACTKLSITGPTPASVSSPGGSFFYTVATTDTTKVESVTLAFSLSPESSGALPTGLPPITASVSLTDTSPSKATNMPIFTAAEFTPPDTVVTFAACQTFLMWPFVTNVGKWDTDIGVANTTLDPIVTGGAVPQSGPCTFYYFAAGAKAITFTSPTVSPGSFYGLDVGKTTWSAPVTGLTGYVIGICQFQNAHGYAWVSYAGLGAGLASNYIADIIPNPAIYPRNPAGMGYGEMAITPP
jgi:hypothetical protein